MVTVHCTVSLSGLTRSGGSTYYKDAPQFIICIVLKTRQNSEGNDQFCIAHSTRQPGAWAGGGEHWSMVWVSSLQVPVMTPVSTQAPGTESESGPARRTYSLWLELGAMKSESAYTSAEWHYTASLEVLTV